VTQALTKEIRDLARQKDAVILAHNYELGDVQDVADMVGDSLALARQAAVVDSAVIVLAGVHFMAETAKILVPDSTVLLPVADAGCPMADMLTEPQLAAWRDEFPGVPVVTYVNSSASVKALSDVCCTSSNAVAVVESLAVPRILFGPDRNLASWVARNLPDVEVIAWDGCCPTHDVVTVEMARAAIEAHPDAEVLAHPECKAAVVDLADRVLSTGGMLTRVEESASQEFIILTEGGLLHSLSKATPGKSFYQPEPVMICPDMKKTSLESVRDALVHMRYEIDVPEDVRHRAKSAVERMVAIG